MSGLADRIRGIVAPRVGALRDLPGLSAPPDRPALPDPPDLVSVLGGAWQHDPRGSCFIVERRVNPSASYGDARVGDFAARLAEAAPDAPIVAGGAPARPPFVYIDLETTGLSGGAGTHAFLVGCGWFDDDGGFVTRQYVMTRYADERALLATVAGALSRAGALVSFNGKSFDAPVLETRYLFHRLEWAAGRLPHLDVLHPARRFWGMDRRGSSACGHASGRERDARRGRGPSADLGVVPSQARDEASASDSPEPTALGVGPQRREEHRAPREARNDVTSCSLIALERQVLGARRIGDVSGFEIPARYFQFVRSGDARPLAAVLEHNRLDLLSLAGLTARLLHLVRSGAEAARDAREALALGCVYGRAGLDARARDAYERAASGGASAVGAASIAATAASMAANKAENAASMAATAASMAAIKIDALRALAILSRRARRYDEAAACWRRLLDLGGGPSHVVREASEALAIHHEHRARDLAAAKTFALRSLEYGRHPAWADAVRHRLARIERKIESGKTGALRLDMYD